MDSLADRRYRRHLNEQYVWEGSLDWLSRTVGHLDAVLFPMEQELRQNVGIFARQTKLIQQQQKMKENNRASAVHAELQQAQHDRNPAKKDEVEVVNDLPSNLDGKTGDSPKKLPNKEQEIGSDLITDCDEANQRTGGCQGGTVNVVAGKQQTSAKSKSGSASSTSTSDPLTAPAAVVPNDQIHKGGHARSEKGGGGKGKGWKGKGEGGKGKGEGGKGGAKGKGGKGKGGGKWRGQKNQEWIPEWLPYSKWGDVVCGRFVALKTPVDSKFDSETVLILIN
jgi:hypothetical protein